VIACVSVLFFFQAEDGIRDLTVTGVQTCALPILDRRRADQPTPDPPPAHDDELAVHHACARGPARRGKRGTRLPAVSILAIQPRSEERRVGKECRSRWSPYH